jgi:hypothetical protein
LDLTFIHPQEKTGQLSNLNCEKFALERRKTLFDLRVRAQYLVDRCPDQRSEDFESR